MPDTPDAQALAFYRQITPSTDLGAHTELARALPDDPAALVRAVQGLLIHEHLAACYGLTPAGVRREESQRRQVRAMLDQLLGRAGGALGHERPPAQRQVGVCRHFSLLLVALLRQRGQAARARCGFASYFQPGMFLDHWVCELWEPSQGRWRLIDAQLDPTQLELFKPDFDPLDVPRDRFLVAGEAWRWCRDGLADPQAFGILDLLGWWMVAGNVVRDLAALNNREMLPWDVWGLQPQPEPPIDDTLLARLDRLAEFSRRPDVSFAGLREAYDQDPEVRVPPMVFNAITQRPEAAG